MRINKLVAQATGMSRRAADELVAAGRVTIADQIADQGSDVGEGAEVRLDGKLLTVNRATVTIMLNKPSGYVVSRNGQGSATIYDLLAPDLHTLKPVGRLDKDSSGLLLLTNDGQLANDLTHPSRQKRKLYEVSLDKPLQPLHHQLIADKGITLEDGNSQLGLERQHDDNDTDWLVSMHQGRNRQIRRTFAALDYKVTRLHRTQFGPYLLNDLKEKDYRFIMQ